MKYRLEKMVNATPPYIKITTYNDDNSVIAGGEGTIGLTETITEQEIINAAEAHCDEINAIETAKAAEETERSNIETQIAEYTCFDSLTSYSPS